MPERLAFDTGVGSVELVAEPTRLRVLVSGEVDYETSPQLDEIFRGVAARQPMDVVVDLDETTFIDSVGLGFVVRLHQLVGRTGNKLTVIASGAHVRRMFGLTGLDRVLTIAAQPSGRI